MLLDCYQPDRLLSQPTSEPTNIITKPPHSAYLHKHNVFCPLAHFFIFLHFTLFIFYISHCFTAPRAHPFTPFLTPLRSLIHPLNAAHSFTRLSISTHFLFLHQHTVCTFPRPNARKLLIFKMVHIFRSI